MESIRVALAGIGGYGQTYVNQILDHPDARIKVVGVIDPYPELCRHSALEVAGR